jgi:NADH-quinone oxidoreductase subunit J
MLSLPVVLYVASLVGAVAVYMLLPGDSRTKQARRAGGLLGAGAVGLLFLTLGSLLNEEQLPNLFFYAFAIISIFSAVVVITHPRPVYSALYFVMIVLSSSGMLVLLEAEFMAFAMVIIYGGAILVTYMFVIMLATLPQTAGEPETAAAYDCEARQPLMSTLAGFMLIASLCGVMFEPPREAPIGDSKSIVSMPAPRAAGGGRAQLMADAADLPGKFKPAHVEAQMRRLRLIGAEDHVFEANDVDLKANVVFVRASIGAARRPIALNEQAKDQLVQGLVLNTDRVGLNLFKGHTLGLELAAVILLLAMVGAIVVSRRQIETVRSGKGQQA